MVFPTAGFEPLGVEPTDSVVRVELVPIVYQADGSDRALDTSAGQLKQYQDRFCSIRVEIDGRVLTAVK